MNPREATDAQPLVLVADDDSATRFLIHKALEQAGLSVLDAENGAQALTLFEAHRPHIVLLDVMMPQMDGFAACAAIRRLPRGATVPILMLTGLDDLDSIKRAYEAGATDFAAKPINWLVLSHRVRYLLRMGRVLEDLAASEARLAAAQRIAHLGNWEWNLRTDAWYWSDELYRLLGYQPREIMPGIERFLERLHPEDREAVAQIIECSRREQGAYGVEFRVRLPDGAVRYLHAQGEVVGDERGDPAKLSGTIQDVSARKQAEDQISFLENYDKLTGLPNRVRFKERLDQALATAKRQTQKLAVLVLDLDRFKRVNDTMGHSLGDRLVQAVAKRIEACVSEDSPPRVGAFARLGGDEFSLLLPDLKHPADAAAVSRRILEALSKPFRLEAQEVFITASVGIGRYPEDGSDCEALLKNADTAMYHAKGAGGNGYRLYDHSMNAAAFERLTLENGLRRALERGEFLLYYQPQIEIQSGAIAGAEALLRWRHPELGLVPPDRFIPLAEETGLILPIGEWVLRTACAQALAWRRAGLPPVRVAVNLSARQFRDETLAESIAQALRLAELDPQGLGLEITESVIMQNASGTVNTLQELKRMGLSISVDDFGTGYSSLSYLKRFPIDVLKIDRSFVRDLATNPDDAAIASAIIAMAKSLKLDTVAEGVETEEQLAILRQYGCRLVQGFLFSKALPAEEFEVLLREQKSRRGASE